MGRTPKDITDAELAVLEALWRRADATVKELATDLYPGGGNSEAATVQKLCERLCAKGFAARDRRSRPRRFRATVDRQELIGRQLQSVAERFCEGSFVPLVSHLFQRGALRADEIRELKAHVERVARQRRGAERRKPEE